MKAEIYYTYASKDELLAVGVKKETIFEDIAYLSECSPLQQASLTNEQCHELIPQGEYCYTQKGGKFKFCPFHDLVPTMPKQSNGYCHYLKCGDFTENPTDLLWDSCKCCGVNL